MCVNFEKKMKEVRFKDRNGTTYLVYERYPFVRGVRFKILEEQPPLL